MSHLYTKLNKFYNNHLTIYMDEDKYEVVKELIITMIETAKETVQKKYKSNEGKDVLDIMDHIVRQLLSLTMNG